MARDKGDHNENANDEIKINDNGSELGIADEQPSERLKVLEDKLEDKINSYNDLYERYLRIAADFDNYKKRMSKEKSDLVAYGNEELIKALLNVIDNLERALEHKDSQSSSKSLIEGVDLVCKQFLSTLEKFGLERISAEKGSKFDPNYHQAVEHIETDDLTPGLIVNEMVKGYTLKERLIRPSMVAVSKGLKKTLNSENLTRKEDEKLSEQKKEKDFKAIEDEDMFKVPDTGISIDDGEELNTSVDIDSINGNSDLSDEDIIDLLVEDKVDDGEEK